MTAPTKGDDMFPAISAWPQEIELSDLLDEINKTIGQFIVCDPETATAATLWVAFTWVIDQVSIAPLALITAPEKGCGKTQLLDVMGQMVAKPLPASNITAAALFRTIDKYRPTLLLDEADTFLRDNEELRGIINSGHTRSAAFTIRTVGDNYEPKRFSTWGAKAICGIGTQHDTIMDRSIPLKLRRRLPNEKVQRLRHADKTQFERLRQQLSRFAQDYGQDVAAVTPELPNELGDRAQDNWEPLLAIADLAGGRWPSQARNAALTLSRQEQLPSIAVQLLGDIQCVFETVRKDRLGTADLLNRLGEIEDAPWANYSRGVLMRPHELAKMLKGFGIGPAKKRFGGSTAQGYQRSDFEDAWSRYLRSAQEEVEKGKETNAPWGGDHSTVEAPF